MFVEGLMGFEIEVGIVVVIEIFFYDYCWIGC